MNRRILAFSTAIALASALSARADSWYPSSGNGWQVRSAKLEIGLNHVSIRADRPASAGGGILEFLFDVNFGDPASVAKGNSLLALALSAQAAGTPTYFKVTNPGAVTTASPGIITAVQVGND